MPAPLNIIDGDFTTPKEVDGSGVVSIDEITRAKIVTRLYCVERTFFIPLLVSGVYTPIPDYQYPTCFLVEERPNIAPGRMLFFTRVYVEVPATRTEPRMVAFPMPGKTGVYISARTSQAINWKQYGNGAPYVKAIMGTTEFTYAVGNPNGLFSPPTLTTIFYTPPNGSGRIQVDYVGQVYDFTGTRGIPAGPFTLESAEPSYTYVGTTDPATIPNPWIYEVNITRWRGDIWQMEVTRVPTT